MNMLARRYGLFGNANRIAVLDDRFALRNGETRNFVPEGHVGCGNQAALKDLSLADRLQRNQNVIGRMNLKRCWQFYLTMR